MALTSWLPLTEYSGKYKVSISTLRRRIRTNRTEHIYEEGKYLLKDTPLDEHNPNSQLSSKNDSAPPHQDVESATFIDEKAEAKSLGPKTTVESGDESPFLTTANKLLGELKKAYTLILQEKEEQVMILKDEVADLQTLVRVLEGENKRLRDTLANSLANEKNESKKQLLRPIITSHWPEELEIE